MSNRQDRNSQSDFKIIAAPAIQSIIQGTPEESARVTIQEAERLAKHLVAEDLKAAQIRLVFSKVRQIEARWTNDAQHEQASLREMLLLKPRLKYQSKRTPSMEALSNTLISLIDAVKNRPQFQRFVDFFEAVVAYHKVSGGKD